MALASGLYRSLSPRWSRWWSAMPKTSSSTSSSSSQTASCPRSSAKGCRATFRARWDTQNAFFIGKLDLENLATSHFVLDVQDERPKPVQQQFSMRFGTAMDRVSISRSAKIFSNKLEKEKSYEGQRLPMSPTGTSLYIWILYNTTGRCYITHWVFVKMFTASPTTTGAVKIAHWHCRWLLTVLMLLAEVQSIKNK